MSMNQLTFFGVVDESEAKEQLKIRQREELEAALTASNFRHKHTAWLVAIVTHCMATGDGVLRRSAAWLASDGYISRSVRSVREARKKLVAAGIVEIIPIKSPDGGDDLKAMRIHRVNCRKIAAGIPIANAIAQNLHPERQGEDQGESHPERRGENSEPLYGSKDHLPPPPSTDRLSATEKAAADCLRKFLSDANLVRRLATTHTAEIADVVAEYEINRDRLRGPGSIRYRLEEGYWPTDEPLRSIDGLRRHQAARRAAVEEARQELERQNEESKVIARLESKHGAALDAMSESSRLALATEVLDPQEIAGYMKFPTIYRLDILKSMSGREPYVPEQVKDVQEGIEMKV